MTGVAERRGSRSSQARFDTPYGDRERQFQDIEAQIAGAEPTEVDARPFDGLLAGDLILTGTPAGTGHARGRYLRDGDVIVSHILGLGTQRNVCVSQPSPPAAAVERT